MSDPASTRRWFRVGPWTLLLLAPYTGCLAWIWTWRMQLPTQPEPRLWKGMFERDLADGLLTAGQVYATVLATIVLAAIWGTPRIIEWARDGYRRRETMQD